MAIWPFRRRRRTSASRDAAQSKQPLSEKPQPQPSTTEPSPHTPSVPRRSSRRGSRRGRRASQKQQDRAVDAQWQDSEKRSDSTANKENIPLRRRTSSKEDITALPMSRKLQHSPHLRPIDLERPHIPYNFRPHSMSQTSVQRPEAIVKPARPQTLHSKRSTTDYGTPTRKTSKSSKRRDDALREEEIRSMTAPIPIPKRPGDGPLRQDSKKFRGGAGNRESNVSLPPEGSIHSSMSGVLEQRGWEIGGFAFFSPRPAIRLSGTPQYVVTSSLPPSPSGVLYRIDSTRKKDKASATRDNARKRRTVGEEADDLDTTDIRTLMERDAKRRERRQQERQEKLDRKLRSREGRNRGDSDLKRRDAEEAKGMEAGKARAEGQIQARGPLTPPSDVHPALRDQTAQDQAGAEAVGLGIAEHAAAARNFRPHPLQESAIPTTEEQGTENTGTYLRYPQQGDIPENPFSDAAEVFTASPRTAVPPAASSGVSLPLETHMEEPAVLGTAQAVRLSTTNTPPLSPVYGQRAPSSASQIAEALRKQSESPLPQPPRIPVERRSSDPPRERRAGAWASFFRRGTNLRKGGNDEAPSEHSFSNTSRESMRNQPIPAHLIDSNARRPSTVRSKSGTPVRTQSKFREDLPEIPISPPESRTQSADVTTAAAAVAAARRAGRVTPQPVDIPGRMRDADRNDTPLSQSMRGHHGAVSGSLASIDSEGSWLASGSVKRQSGQSGLGRSFSQRNPEFSASYEELGGDRDAEYFNRNNMGSRSRKVSNPALMGASPDEESGEDIPDETPGVTVRGSVRRKPTLVERDPRLKSREGLVQEFAAAEMVETPGDSPERDNADDDSDTEVFHDTQLERARSIQYGSRHSRHFSAGSAKLLDVPPSKRASFDQGSRNKTPTPEPPVNE